MWIKGFYANLEKPPQVTAHLARRFDNLDAYLRLPRSTWASEE
jgi:hypothetical protein